MTRALGVLLVVLLPVVVGCEDSLAVRVDYVTVSLANAESYTYQTAGGDEEGARVSSQPRHLSVSTIPRSPQTNWMVTFVFQPAAGFVGTDRAEIEVSGSDGAGPPTYVRRVVFVFDVHN